MGAEVNKLVWLRRYVGMFCFVSSSIWAPFCNRQAVEDIITEVGCGGKFFLKDLWRDEKPWKTLGRCPRPHKGINPLDPF